MRDGGLLLIYPGLAVLLVIPLSLNLFLFKKKIKYRMWPNGLQQFPLGSASFAQGHSFYIMIRFILSSNSGATFMPVFITAIYHVIAFKAILWFRSKIEQNASTDS